MSLYLGGVALKWDFTVSTGRNFYCLYEVSGTRMKQVIFDVLIDICSF